MRSCREKLKYHTELSLETLRKKSQRQKGRDSSYYYDCVTGEIMPSISRLVSDFGITLRPE